MEITKKRIIKRKNKNDVVVETIEYDINYLKKKNSHPRDDNISFEEEGHVYTICGEVGTYISTTTFIHHNFSDFDADDIINKMMLGRNWNNPEYKYYGMTREQIKALWDKNRDNASGAGTQMHADIEKYSNNVQIFNNSIEFQYFLAFRKDFPQLIPYRTEWCVYYEEYKLCGSIDMVYQNENGKFEIYDWKRSKEIVYDSPFNKCAKTECIKHLPDTNFWHYALQLNTYKKILEDCYGIQVEDMYLVVCHPESAYQNYDRVRIPHLPNEINDLFNVRKMEINK